MRQVLQTAMKSTLSFLEKFIVWNKTNMITCDNCGQVYDGTWHRWLCPFCKTKSSCCEGAPCDLDSP